MTEKHNTLIEYKYKKIEHPYRIEKNGMWSKYLRIAI